MATREPVIIVGAGPAGLTVALSLALRDVPVVVLESEPGLPHDPLNNPLIEASPRHGWAAPRRRTRCASGSTSRSPR